MKNPYFTNKFDSINSNVGQGFYNPFMFQQTMPMPMNPSMYYHQQPVPQYQQPFEDESEKSIAEILEYYFSEENLNKDAYIRSRMNEDGYIDAYEIVNFNKMKNRNMTVEKIEEILNNNKESIIEYVVSQDKRLYLRNKFWESFKDKLIPLENLQMQKKFTKKPQAMNFVNMQNNYFYQMQPNMFHNFAPGFDVNSGHMFVQPNMMGYPMGMMPPYMDMGNYMNDHHDNVNN